MSEETKEKPQTIDHLERISKALENRVPEIYFNGFTNGLGMGDVVSTLERNGKPVAVLNMSYTLAKTLAESLTKVISDLEKESGNDIMTTHDLVRMFENADRS